MTATSAETTQRRVPPRRDLVQLAMPEVDRYGSIGGWRGESTRLTNVHAGGIAGWLNREILPQKKHFTIVTGEMSLREVLDQVYAAT